MVILPPAIEPSIPEHQPAYTSFTEGELLRLRCLEITAAAERHLVAETQPCPDHHACRRLAFALWLHRTGRLSEGTEQPGCSAPAYRLP